MLNVVQEKREYQRILPSDKSIDILESNGLEWVFSSNVSAATVRGKDLIIRFHNGSIYQYPNEGKNFERLMGAASKGKWVWRFLRRPNKPYSKIGSLPLPEDTDESDQDIIKPRIPTHEVSVIVPKDYMLTGELPQIRIVPIKRLGADDVIPTHIAGKPILTMKDQVFDDMFEKLLADGVKKTEDMARLEVSLEEVLKNNAGVTKYGLFNKKKMNPKDLEVTANAITKLTNEYNVKIDNAVIGYVHNAPPGTYGRTTRENGKMTYSVLVKPAAFWEKKQKAWAEDKYNLDNFGILLDENKGGEYVVTHEMAHTFHNFEEAKWFKKHKLPIENEQFGKEIIKIQKDYVKRQKLLKDKRWEAENKYFNGKIPSANKAGEFVWNSPEAIEYHNELQDINISRYAMSNTDEFMAEAFTEAKLSSNPSPYSVEVLETIDMYFKKE